MTDKEKVKAYDEAIERANKVLLDCTKEERNVVEYLHPELIESEDERIRRELTSLFEDGIKGISHRYTGEDCGRWLTWLEKQGRQKPLYIRFGDVPSNETSKIYRGEVEIGEENGVSVYPAFEVNGNIVLGLTLPITKTTLYTQQHLLEYDNRPCYLVSGDYVGKGTDGEPLIRNITIIKRLDNYRIKNFEKQGEQKFADEVEPKFKVGDIMRTKEEVKRDITDGLPVVVSIDNEYYHCNNELIAIKNQEDYEFPPLNSQQKPDDKANPKFYEGEWVVIDKNNVVQIKAIEDSKYVLENTMRFSVDYVDKCWRKWTIQDAKDGDVLVSPPLRDDQSTEQIFMFKMIDNRFYLDNCIEFYNRICDGVFYENEEGYYMGTTSSPVYPATKEQRELFFKKMHEAGFEWDAERKQLKKLIKK